MKKKYSVLVLIALFSLAINPLLLKGQSCDNLTAYWRMEEKAGNTYTDLIGGHDAVGVTSSPFRDVGKVGKAQSFNGTSDYLLVSDHPDFDWSGYLTKLLDCFEEYGLKSEALPKGRMDNRIKKAVIKDSVL